MVGRFIGIASLLSLDCKGGAAFQVHTEGPAFRVHKEEPAFRVHTEEPAFQVHTAGPGSRDYKEIHTAEPNAQA